MLPSKLDATFFTSILYSADPVVSLSTSLLLFDCSLGDLRGLNALLGSVERRAASIVILVSYID